MTDKSFTKSNKRKWSPAPNMLAVYSGQKATGFLIKRGRSGIEAFDVDGISVGLFSTMHTAIVAVSSEWAADVA
jgi:hypothetical protein